MKKKKIITRILIVIATLLILGALGAYAYFVFLPKVLNEISENALKPVIYLYPEENKEVTVELDLEGELVCTYPAYTEPWKVMAQPDGKLTDVNTGLEYSYLFFVYGCRLGGDLLIREIKSASIQCGEI